MKVGQFSDSFLPIVDGVGRVAYNYCDAIARKGHECCAIVPFDKMGYRGKYPFEIIDYYSKSLLIRPEYDIGIPPFDFHYKARLDQTDFDIVHVHTPFVAGAEGIKYAKEHKIPIVGSFHSKYYDDFLQITKSKHLAEFGTDLIIDFYNHCDEVWTVSHNSAEVLKSYGYKKEIRVMPNGMNEINVSKDDVNEIKKQFNINDEMCLLYVGQMNWKKNILRILEACSLLKKDGIEFNLLLAGKGPHEKEIEDKIKELDIVEQTHMLGHISDDKTLFGLYSLADLFLFPSTYDTYSLVVREAAYSSTASIVVRDSAPAECIDNGVNGLYCEDNSQSLYETIKYAIIRPKFTRKLGILAKETIPISWDEVIDKVIDRYARLIEHHQ